MASAHLHGNSGRRALQDPRRQSPACPSGLSRDAHWQADRRLSCHHKYSGADVSDCPVDPLRKSFPRDGTARDDTPVSILELFRAEAEDFCDLHGTERPGEVLLVCEHQQGRAGEFLPNTKSAKRYFYRHRHRPWSVVENRATPEREAIIADGGQVRLGSWQTVRKNG